MIERLRGFTYARQRLGRAAPDAATALREVVGVYSAHPSAPLSLHARAPGLDAAAFGALDALRLPAMRASIHMLPRATAHLPFRALPEPEARARKRLQQFKLTEARYAELRAAILAAAGAPRTLEELREATGADAEAVKGATAMMTRDGALVRVGAAGLRSNALRYAAADVPDADPDEALAWLAGEYLRAFGPARRADVLWWIGAGARRIDGALARQETVDAGGGLLLRAQDEAAFAAAAPVAPDAVDLLPKWDAYTMGFAPDGRGRFADPEHVARCYDFRGDGLPVVLVGGAAAGTWEAPKGKDPVLDLWATPSRTVRAALDERVAAVRALLD